jgi:hypothetical protein
MSMPLQFGLPGGLELLVIAIIGLVLLVLPFVMAYWVYTDAEKRGEDNGALWAVVVGGLTFLTFFGGVLALVVYVWQRPDSPGAV